jgi:hypothetical protein
VSYQTKKGHFIDQQHNQKTGDNFSAAGRVTVILKKEEAKQKGHDS